MVKQDSLQHDYNMEGIIRGEKGGNCDCQQQIQNIDTRYKGEYKLCNIINILDQEIHHVLPFMGTG